MFSIDSNGLWKMQNETGQKFSHSESAVSLSKNQKKKKHNKVFIHVILGTTSIHLVVFSVMTSVVLHGVPKFPQSFTATLLLTFGYLVSFRIWQDCAQTHGFLMQMALRVISLAVDLRNSSCSCTGTERDENCVYCTAPKSIPMILGYLWCYVGLPLTPAIRYRTYEHFVKGRFVVPRVRREELFVELMKIVASIAPLATILHVLLPIDFSLADEFLEKPLWFKLFYIAAMSFSFRCRLQVGLLLGEASAVALGLGLYSGSVECAPETGPIGVDERPVSDVNTRTIFSVRPSVELEVTLAAFVVKWNRTVQSWLVRCFYKRFTGPKTLRLLTVFLLSGFWHGNSIGHWLFFVQVGTYILLGEAGFTAAENGVPFLLKLIVHYLAFGYWHLPYLVLDLSRTLRIYSSLYFCGHLLLLVSVGLKYCLNHSTRVSKKYPENVSD